MFSTGIDRWFMFDRHDFFEREYYHELERRQSLMSLTSIPIGLIGVEAGAIGFLATRFKFGGANYFSSHAIETLFKLSIGSAVAGLLAACWFAGKQLIGPGYRFIPDSGSLHGYLARLIAWNAAKGLPDAEAAAEAKFGEFLIVEFAKNTQQNRFNNSRQSEFLWFANLFTAVAGIWLVIALSCYYVDFLWDPPPPK
jgi:hypothetical protein